MALRVDGRHPSTQHFARMFEWEHLSPDLQPMVIAISGLAQGLIDLLGDGPELSAGLRKFVEAKDCFVRQAIIDTRGSV